MSESPEASVDEREPQEWGDGVERIGLGADCCVVEVVEEDVAVVAWGAEGVGAAAPLERARELRFEGLLGSAIVAGQSTMGNR